jgi:hypothetical protein
MKSNLVFIYHIVPIETENFEYSYFSPLSKEILNHWGYPSKVTIFRRISQILLTTLVNGGQSTYLTKLKTRGVSHCGLAIYIKKYLKAKKENYGNSNISPCKNIIFKKCSKRNQNPSRYYNSIIINLKF